MIIFQGSQSHNEIFFYMESSYQGAMNLVFYKTIFIELYIYSHKPNHRFLLNEFYRNTPKIPQILIFGT